MLARSVTRVDLPPFQVHPRVWVEPRMWQLISSLPRTRGTLLFSQQGDGAPGGPLHNIDLLSLATTVYE